MAGNISKTDAYVTASYARKKVEMLFVHLKHTIGLDRLRLRGPNGAKDAFIMAATVQNLRKLAKLVPNVAVIDQQAANGSFGRLQVCRAELEHIL